MLKTRLIPLLLLNQGRMVKGVNFGNFRDVGQPISTAKIYDAQAADELVLLDISASREGRKALFDAVGEIAEHCFMPLTAGGGVRTVEDARKLLVAGADKVALNTAAVEKPELITEIAEQFGAQCVVVSIDVKTTDKHRWEVFTHAGTKPTNLEAVAWAKYAVHLGAGELLVTNVDREGRREGYDLEFLRAVSEAVSVPVIASGGVGTLQDLVDGVKLGKAAAVSCASLFHFTDQSVIKARAFMKMAGLPMRIA